MTPQQRLLLEQSALKQGSQGVMSNQDANRVRSLLAPSNEGLFSSAMGAGRGLLDFGRSVGGGLMSGARAVGQNINADQLQKDIVDTQRFYQQAMMSQPRQVLAQDLGMLKNISPAGIAASLPLLRAQEASALQEPELEKMKAEKTSGGYTGARYKNKQLLVNKNDPKDFITAIFDTEKQTLVRMDNGEPVGDEYKVSTSSIQSKGVMGVKDLRDTVPKLQESENALRQGQMFLDKIEDFEGGFEGKMRNLKSKFSTFFGQELTPQELARMAALGSQEGLLGAFRREVVGPGVLTEPDAQRVMARLGGYAGDWTANPELIARAVKEVMDEKYFAYAESNEDYNYDARSLGQRERKTIMSPIIGPPQKYYDDGGTDELWSRLTYDQKQKARRHYSE